MAPVLQCPDCGEKHPIAKVPAQGAFPCQGCGRVLKVPAVVAQRLAATGAGGGAGAGAPRPGAGAGAAGAAAAAGGAAAAGVAGPAVRPEPPRPRPVPIATAVANPNAAASEAASTRAVGQVEGAQLGMPGRGNRRPIARLGPVPWWMRLLLWIVAVPVSFLLVFVIARAFGLFTSDQLSDLFLANNTSRFWPAARLLPFVALVTAGFVQGGVFGLARWRGRKLGGTRAFEDLSGSTRSTSRPRATS